MTKLKPTVTFDLFPNLLYFDSILNDASPNLRYSWKKIFYFFYEIWLQGIGLCFIKWREGQNGDFKGF